MEGTVHTISFEQPTKVTFCKAKCQHNFMCTCAMKWITIDESGNCEMRVT